MRKLHIPDESPYDRRAGGEVVREWNLDGEEEERAECQRDPLQSQGTRRQRRGGGAEFYGEQEEKDEGGRQKRDQETRDGCDDPRRSYVCASIRKAIRKEMQ